MLMMGDAISFRSGEHFAFHLDSELEQGRLMAIDIAGVELHTPRTFVVQVQGVSKSVRVEGVAVHRQGDVVGLQLTCDGKVRRSLRDLLEATGASSPPPKPKTTPDPEPAPAPPSAGVPGVLPRQGSAPPLVEPPPKEEPLGVAPTPPPASREAIWAEPTDVLAPEDLGQVAVEPTPAPEIREAWDADPFGEAEPQAAPEPPPKHRLPPPPSAAEVNDMGGLLLDGPPPTQPPTPAPRPVSDPVPALRPPPSTGPMEAVPAERQPVAQGVLRIVTGPLDLASNFGSPTLFSLLRELQRACRVGQLTLLLPDGPRSFSLDRRGCICDFDGDITAALVDEEHIERRDVPEVSRFKGAMTQAYALAEGVVPGVRYPPINALRAILRRQLLEVLIDISERRDIRYFFDPNERARSVRDFRLPFLDYGRDWLETALQRRLRLDQFEKHFGRKKELFPVVPEDRRWHPLMLSLGRAEARFVKDAIPKGKSLRDLLTFSPLSRVASYRLMLELEALDMLRFDAEPPDFAVAANIEEALGRRLAQSRVSQFGALGMHVTAHHSEYQPAIERIRKRYGPSGKLARHSRKAAQLCKQVVSKATEAHEFLKVRRQRIAYRREIHSQTELFGFAELLAGKVQLAHFRGNEKLARELLEAAREMDPNVRP